MEEEGKKELRKLELNEWADVELEVMPSLGLCGWKEQELRSAGGSSEVPAPFLYRMEVAHGHTWKSSACFVAAWLAPHGAGSAQQHPRGRHGTARVAASVSLRPPNVPGFNVR